MKKIYTWAAVPAKRTLTAGDLKATKGKKQSSNLNSKEFENS
tara:strand:- start:1568 stop:1693 length:126 start_codon:yes stop_codon:yes gene_type:complete